MRHRQAVEFLPQLHENSLSAEVERELLEHVKGCGRCREWLKTREFLQAALLGVEGNEAHPDSHTLALCVVRPEEIYETNRTELREHFAGCPQCRDELRSTREAILSARPEAVATPAGAALRSSRNQRLRRSLAASLAVLVLGAGAYAGKALLTDSSASRYDAEESFLESHQEYFGQDIEGTQVIQGTGNLVVSKLTVKSGADATFRSDGSVAFSDGFRVAEGASVRVGSSQLQPEKSD